MAVKLLRRIHIDNKFAPFINKIKWNSLLPLLLWCCYLLFFAFCFVLQFENLLLTVKWREMTERIRGRNRQKKRKNWFADSLSRRKSRQEFEMRDRCELAHNCTHSRWIRMRNASCRMCNAECWWLMGSECKLYVKAIVNDCKRSPIAILADLHSRSAVWRHYGHFHRQDAVIKWPPGCQFRTAIKNRL